ncbi:Dolichyl-phosphate-mannose-protein mannosyltransferase [Halomicrobium zhouii]|uniref:Dolichyl-phosphate-mannose-protein mannosyltransferase n=1 Tax=Halomicrobium zhouii TaxID=767519 RepID=A0A1I6KH40_9EURY|nr:glycosyltransferase family 39 protein [Halomicrobium zhouii]SFR90190.1 Dolichyl-phosphate-mannose-protein mannosyltransferase [Halomicrobium zhouii]
MRDRLTMDVKGFNERHFDLVILLALLYLIVYSLYPTYLAFETTLEHVLIILFVLLHLSGFYAFARYYDLKPVAFRIPSPLEPNRWLTLAALGYLLLQAVAMPRVIPTGGDVASHATINFIFHRHINNAGLFGTPAVVKVAAVLLILLALLYCISTVDQVNPALLLGGVFVVGLLALRYDMTTGEQMRASMPDYFISNVVRFPPFAALIYIFSTALFGYSEPVILGIQSVFFILSSIVLYNLARQYRGETVALGAAVVFLFSPISIFYGHLTYIEPAMTFFMLLSTYYLFQYVQSKEVSELVLASILLSAAFLFKRPAIVATPLLLLSVVYLNRHNWTITIRDLTGVYLGTAPMIPWLYVSNKYVWRSYDFTPGNWLSESAFTYLFALPGQVTVFVSALFLVGLPVAVYSERDAFTAYSIGIIGIFYVFFTSDAWLGVHRFVLPYLPFVIVIAVSAISVVKRSVGTQQLNYAVGGLVILVILSQLAIPPAISGSMYTVSDQSDTPRDVIAEYRYDLAFQYVDSTVAEDQVVISLHQACCPPHRFYLRKSGMGRSILAITPDSKVESEADLADVIVKREADVVLIPVYGNTIISEQALDSVNQYGYVDNVTSVGNGRGTIRIIHVNKTVAASTTSPQY